MGEDKKIKFDNKCTMCLRCLHQCPVSAIQIGKTIKCKFGWKGPKQAFYPWKIK